MLLYWPMPRFFAGLGAAQLRLADWLLEGAGLIVLHDEFGRQEEARAAHEAAYQVSVERFGAAHPNTPGCLADLSAICGELGARADALRHAESNLAARCALHAPDHPEVLDARTNLTLVLAKMERQEEALVLQREIAERLGSLRGDWHPDTLDARLNVATTLQNLDLACAAASILRSVVATAARRLDGRHPSTLIEHLRAWQDLADLLEHQDRWEDFSRFASR